MKINENTKVTLTINQIKSLIRESEIEDAGKEDAIFQCRDEYNSITTVDIEDAAKKYYNSLPDTERTKRIFILTVDSRRTHPFKMLRRKNYELNNVLDWAFVDGVLYQLENQKKFIVAPRMIPSFYHAGEYEALDLPTYQMHPCEIQVDNKILQELQSYHKNLIENIKDVVVTLLIDNVISRDWI